MDRIVQRKDRLYEDAGVMVDGGKRRKHFLSNHFPSWIVYSSAVQGDHNDSSSDATSSEDEEDERKYRFGPSKSWHKYDCIRPYRETGSHRNYPRQDTVRAFVPFTPGDSNTDDGVGEYQPRSSEKISQAFKDYQQQYAGGYPDIMTRDQHESTHYQDFMLQDCHGGRHHLRDNSALHSRSVCLTDYTGAQYHFPATDLLPAVSSYGQISSSTSQWEQYDDSGHHTKDKGSSLRKSNDDKECSPVLAGKSEKTSFGVSGHQTYSDPSNELAIASIKAKCAKIVHLLDLQQARRKKGRITPGDGKEERKYVINEKEVRHNQGQASENDAKELCVQDREDGQNCWVSEKACLLEQGKTTLHVVEEEEMGMISDNYPGTPDDEDVDTGPHRNEELQQEREKLQKEDKSNVDTCCLIQEKGGSIRKLKEDDEHGSPTVFLDEYWSDDEEQSESSDGTFWWDDKDIEDELELSTSKEYHSGSRANQHVLLEEWYEIEKILGMEEDPHVLPDEVVGHEERQTLLAEWTLIEEALELENMLGKTVETSNQCSSGNRAQLIQDIIAKAQLDKQGVVAKALEDIRVVEDTTGHQCHSLGVQDIINEGPLCRDCIKPNTEDLWDYDHLLPEKYSLFPGNEGSGDDIDDVSYIASGMDVLCLDQAMEQDSNISDPLDVEPAHCDFTGQDDAHRWWWPGIREDTKFRMPDEAMENDSPGRRVAWKRRRNKQHQTMSSLSLQIRKCQHGKIKHDTPFRMSAFLVIRIISNDWKNHAMGRAVRRQKQPLACWRYSRVKTQTLRTRACCHICIDCALRRQTSESSFRDWA